MISNINTKHKGTSSAKNSNNTKIRCPSAHNISYGNYKKKDEELK